MAKISLQLLKSKFENGDTPNEKDCIDLIDTLDNSSLTTANIVESVNRKYLLDAELLSISNINSSLSLKEDIDNKNAANGYAGLDNDILIPSNLLPTYLNNGVNYHGEFDCSSGNYPIPIDQGDFWVCSIAGTLTYNNVSIYYAVGDWLVWDGSKFDKIDNQGYIINTDNTLSANSNNIISSQKAVKTYIDTVQPPYILPAATSNTLGGIIVGNGFTIDNNDTLSVNTGSISIISSDTTYNVSSIANLISTYNGLKSTWITDDATVTIVLSEGHYTLTNSGNGDAITLAPHPCGDRIKISGATPTPIELTKIVSLTNTGTDTYNLVCNISSTSNFAVDDYIFIINDHRVSDNQNDYTITGVWRIKSFVENTSVTLELFLKNSTSLIGGVSNSNLDTSINPNAYLMKTVLIGNAGSSGFHSIHLLPYTNIGSIDNLVLNGANTTSYTYKCGIYMERFNTVKLGNLLGITKHDYGIRIIDGDITSNYYVACSYNSFYGLSLERCKGYISNKTFLNSNKLGNGNVFSLINSNAKISNNTYGLQLNGSHGIINEESSTGGHITFNTNYGIRANVSIISCSGVYFLNNIRSGSNGISYVLQLGSFINLKSCTFAGNGNAENGILLGGSGVSDSTYHPISTTTGTAL